MFLHRRIGGPDASFWGLILHLAGLPLLASLEPAIGVLVVGSLSVSVLGALSAVTLINKKLPAKAVQVLRDYPRLPLATQPSGLCRVSSSTDGSYIIPYLFWSNQWFSIVYGVLWSLKHNTCCVCFVWQIHVSRQGKQLIWYDLNLAEVYCIYTHLYATHICIYRELAAQTDPCSTHTNRTNDLVLVPSLADREKVCQRIWYIAEINARILCGFPRQPPHSQPQTSLYQSRRLRHPPTSWSTLIVASAHTLTCTPELADTGAPVDDSYTLVTTQRPPYTHVCTF